MAHTQNTFSKNDFLLKQNSCYFQYFIGIKNEPAKDVGYTVSRLLQKIDEKYPKITELSLEEKRNLNSILGKFDLHV